ncbi:GGDEF domain-containing phosphodiesterase [Kineococcus glutinatus]|uniref:Diguanylate cyclase (GGDEF)-like protein n=1 Tax=Kineococcus glutinatus TaxID=1070872 RepID=A0ABP9I9M2_9ACTN
MSGTTDRVTAAASGTGAVTDFASAAERTLADMRQRIGLDSWWVARRVGDEQVVLAAVDPVDGLATGSSQPWGASYCRQVLAGAAPAAAGRVDDVPALVRAREASGTDAAAVIVVPVTAPSGEVLATVCAIGRREVPGLERALPTVQVQAGMLGVLLAQELQLADQVRRAERAEQAAHTDPLTGVGNRRAWDAALAAEEARAARYAAPASVVVLDLDGLKDVNDVLGHEAGDHLLRQVATVIGKRLRTSDLLARLGGDEFGLLLPATDLAGAEELVADLRDLLAATGVDVSAGASPRRCDGGLAAAWADADAAMYVDKASRRQRAGGPANPPTGAAAVVRAVAAPAAGPAPSPAATAGGTSPGTALPRPGTAPGAVDALLGVVREQVGADLAYISTLEDDHRRYRNLVSPHPLPIAVGHTEPLLGSLCGTVVAGGAPLVVPDTARPPHDTTRSHRELGVGSYVGVPLQRRDGRLYGTLCTVSRAPDPTLRDRDVGILQAVAGAVMELVEDEDRADTHRRGVLARLDDLRTGGGPRMVYQPVVDLTSLRTVGAEALSRFPAGTPAPDRWFAEAALVGAGAALELRAVANALEALPLLPGFLAVNASPATIATPAFARLLAGHRLERLVVEVTEHEAIDDYSRLRQALEPLRARGLRVAVDDTGAGYASMRHVLALVPDVVKLDISLVRGIDADTSRGALAAALVAFAGATGARLVAEGVETAAELTRLRELGVHWGQGYHLARPVPLADLPPAA